MYYFTAMASSKKIMLGSALVAGALVSGTGSASSAVGDQVPILIGRKTIQQADSGFIDEPSFEFGKGCAGIAVDDTEGITWSSPDI